jgi:RNA polymerase sigma factor (sigma-70 family)
MVISATEIAQIWRDKSAALALLARSIGDWHEDSVQEAFLRLAIEDPTPNDPVAWLFRVVRNQAISYRRSQRRRMDRESKVATERELWSRSVADIDARLDSQVATAALMNLSDEEREIVILHLWGGLTFRQVAEVLQLSTATVHRRYQGALQSLRAHLRIESV